MGEISLLSFFCGSLDNFGFRYYDSEIGRFISRDPIGYPGFINNENNYIYVHNDPINFIDPLGLTGYPAEYIEYLTNTNKTSGDNLTKAISNAGTKLIDGGKQVASTLKANIKEQGLLPGTMETGVDMIINIVKSTVKTAMGVDENFIAPMVKGGPNLVSEQAIKRRMDQGMTREQAEEDFAGDALLLGLEFTGVGKATSAVKRTLVSKLKNKMTNMKKSPITKGMEGSNFAQNKTKKSGEFSPEGQAKYSEIAGREIKTIEDLSQAIKDGVVTPEQIPVTFIEVDGKKVILNTRTSKALNDAGVDKKDWYGDNKTGESVPGMDGKTFDDLAKDQTTNNDLPDTGTSNDPQ